MTLLALLFLGAVWAGIQNALAGGGSFVTLPALMLTGLDARAANITSTIALFPGQITTGLMGRTLVAGIGTLPFRALVAISIAGGIVGAVLLLATPAAVFALLVPWLVLFATLIFAWGSFFRKQADPALVMPRPAVAGAAQFLIAVYGGYFGGGIGILMLAALTIAGLTVRVASANKNVLSGMMNASAVLIFLFSGQIHWLQAAVTAAGAVIGGVVGAKLLLRVNEKALRAGIVGIGLLLTAGLFLKQ